MSQKWVMDLNASLGGFLNMFKMYTSMVYENLQKDWRLYIIILCNSQLNENFGVAIVRIHGVECLTMLIELLDSF